MQLLKASELAKQLRLNPETIRRWTRDGKIPFIAVGVTRRYDLDAVLTAINNTATEETSK